MRNETRDKLVEAVVPLLSASWETQLEASLELMSLRDECPAMLAADLTLLSSVLLKASDYNRRRAEGKVTASLQRFHEENFNGLVREAS